MINKLIAVQTALKAPKNLYNSFGKYNYRSCEDILEALKPLLAEQGLLLTITDEPTLIGERFYIKATASVTDGKATASATSYAREEIAKKGMDGSQVTGSASSYARKYALNGLFLIDDNKDADTPPADSKDKLIEACKRLEKACEGYEAAHPVEGKEKGWVLSEMKTRRDFPAQDEPADARIKWFNAEAERLERTL